MNEQLLLLIQLQEIHHEILKAREKHDEIPRIIHDLEGKLRDAKTTYETNRERLAELRRARLEKENQVAANEKRLKDNLAKQYNVKTPKEFDAIKEENAILQKENSDLETEMLELMESIETIEASLGQEETAVAEEEKAIAADKKRHLKAMDKFAEEVSYLEGLAKEIEEKIADRYVRLFHRIAQRRNGIAVSECIEGICQGCQMKSRLQVWTEIARNEKVMQCFSCQRVVYKDSDKVQQAKEEVRASVK